MLLVYGDSVVVCLDVAAGELLPRVGLECFFAQKQGVDPRSAPLLDRLSRLGLAAPAKAQALLQWPGATTPLDAGDLWPDQLVVEGIQREPNVFSFVERRLSHVKVSVASGAVTAKAYFGFGPVWEAPRRDAKKPGVASRQEALGPTTLRDAVNAAVDRLLAARNQGGLWRDFFDRARPAHTEQRVTGYASDEWVTAYVAWALASTGLPRARAAAEEALSLLLSRRDNEAGWGYHALLPPDADTTTWVLRLAGALGRPGDDRLMAGRRFVQGLVGPTGGVSTYERGAARPLADFLRMEGTYVGWCSPHTCVTAAVAALKLSPEVDEFVRRAQLPDGRWTGHWWQDDEYTTARAVEALAEDGRDQERGRMAASWAANRLASDGSAVAAGYGPSPFATALALHVVARSAPAGENEMRAGQRAIAWLLAEQRADGSWAPSSRLRVPAPDEVDPLASPGTTLTYVDDDACFTTATVLAALGAASAGGL
jgi:hypothetical protein